MKKKCSHEDYAQKKLREGKYLIVYCMTDKSAHFFYRIQRGGDKRTTKGHSELFHFKSISNQKRAGAIKFMKNCPKTWFILAGAFKRYGNDIFVWGANRVYDFHLPNEIRLVSEVQFNKIIHKNQLSELDENLQELNRRKIITE